jgi:hypothetical protein
VEFVFTRWCKHENPCGQDGGKGGTHDDMRGVLCLAWWQDIFSSIAWLRWDDLAWIAANTLQNNGWQSSRQAVFGVIHRLPFCFDFSRSFPLTRQGKGKANELTDCKALPVSRSLNLCKLCFPK